MKLPALLMIAASALAHAFLMFREGHWLDSGLNAVRILFCLASLAVYAASARRVRLGTSAREPLAAFAVCAAGLLTIGDALFIHRGDQRGLVFVFVPALQWLVYFAAFLLGR